jgi:hypothetical protein
MKEEPSGDALPPYRIPTWNSKPKLEIDDNDDDDKLESRLSKKFNIDRRILEVPKQIT